MDVTDDEEPVVGEVEEEEKLEEEEGEEEEGADLSEEVR